MLPTATRITPSLNPSFVLPLVLGVAGRASIESRETPDRVTRETAGPPRATRLRLDWQIPARSGPRSRIEV